jgi:hypothetical protein
MSVAAWSAIQNVSTARLAGRRSRGRRRRRDQAVSATGWSVVPGTAASQEARGLTHAAIVPLGEETALGKSLAVGLDLNRRCPEGRAVPRKPLVDAGLGANRSPSSRGR